jgi:tetratricopeptide (TPR) repeat protein
MKRLLPYLLLWLAVVPLPARAEGPDDQYVRIYGLIQAGDELSTSDQASTALAKYVEAQTTLQQFQKVYPDWNPKVVNFRLNYLAAKISAVTTRAPAAPPPTHRPQATTAPVQPATAPNPVAAPEIERQLAALQEAVRLLQADKSSLEAKLKEALAAQPAALDPRELTRAQQQIRELMKENDLLKSSIPTAKPKAAPAPDTKALEETKRALAAAHRKLAEQTNRANALASEKKILQGRLETLARAANDSAQLDETRKALEEANHKLASQSELTLKLASEKDALQARVNTLAANAATAEALRAENEVLKKQLAGARTAAASPAPDTETARKLAAAEVRIAALQSDAEILRLEKLALENRVRTLSSQAPATPLVSSTIIPPASRPSDLARIKLLEDERDELAKKLDAANKELYGRKGRAVVTRIDELNGQITALRARLEVFEARAVPYTTEELALFQKPATQLAAANPNAGKKPLSTLPGGTASFVASAQRHFAAKEFDQAEADYLQILRRDENNVYTLANLAAIQLERGNLADAEKNVKKALAGTPDDAYSLSILGYVKFRQEKYDEALDALSRAAKLNPQSAEIQNYLGVTLSHKGLRGPAETALRKAITIDPNYASAHNNLAVIYLTQQPPSVELARWHYDKARAAGHPRNEELEKAFAQKTPAAENPP